MYLETLEERVRVLSVEVDKLRLQHVQHMPAELDRQKAALLAALEPLAYNPAPTPGDQAALEAALPLLRERFGPATLERLAVMEFHFDSLLRALCPPHLKFLAWLGQQPAAFFENPGGGSGSSGGGAGGRRAGAASTRGGSRGADAAAADPRAQAEQQAASDFWSLFVSELGLSPDQAQRLRRGLHQLREDPDHPQEIKRLGKAILYNRRFRDAAVAATSEVQRLEDDMLSVLSPAQAVRYLGWVERNRDKLAEVVGEQA